MGKKISIYLDGTFNTPDSQTNVYKLFSITEGYISGPDLHDMHYSIWRNAYEYVKDKLFEAEIDHQALDREHEVLNSQSHLRYYDPGVGTRFLNRFRGGFFGRGVSKNIAQAYSFLAQCWQAGDEVYIFGYSRGAYTARSLVGLLNIAGLLDYKQIRNPEDLSQVMTYLHDYIEYLDKENRTAETSQSDEAIKPEMPQVLKNLSASRKNIPIKFIGVWDTVGSIGQPVSFKSLFKELAKDVYETLGNTEVCSNVEYAYHAMAIDEHRVDFNVTPWTFSKESTDLPASLKEIEQLWFVGAHGNVGGGIKGSTLSDIPCQWMQEKAIQAGLDFSEEYQVRDGAFQDKVSDSYALFAGGLFRFMHDRFYRHINFANLDEKGGVINEGFHSSVWTYFLNNTAYQPVNIPQEVVAHNTTTAQGTDVIT